MATVSDKLTKIWDIKSQLKDAITRKGGTLTANAPFSEYPSAIEGINSVPPETPSYEWKPNSSWWDIETILKNDDNSAYQCSYIVLLTNTYATTQLRCGAAYRTSDGAYYTTNRVTHVWDTTKDKESNVGYKTRYVIVYLNAPSGKYEVFAPPDTIGMVAKMNMGAYAYTSSNFYVTPHSYKNLIFFKMLDGYKFLLHTESSTGGIYALGYMIFSGTYVTNLKQLPPIHIQNSMYWDGTLRCNTPCVHIILEGTARPLLYLNKGVETLHIENKMAINSTTQRLSIVVLKDNTNDGRGMLSRVTIDANILFEKVDICYAPLLSSTEIRKIINAFQDATGTSSPTFVITIDQNDLISTSDKLELANKNVTLRIV